MDVASIPRASTPAVSVWSGCASVLRSSAPALKSNRPRARGRPCWCASPTNQPATEPKIMPESPRMLRILLVDDHVTVRHGLKLLIDGEADMKVVAEVGDGASAVALAQELKPDV